MPGAQTNQERTQKPRKDFGSNTVAAGGLCWALHVGSWSPELSLQTALRYCRDQWESGGVGQPVLRWANGEKGQQVGAGTLEPGTSSPADHMEQEVLSESPIQEDTYCRRT